MQIVESGPGYALCEASGISHRVNTMLVGDQPAGTWVLVFLDSAREVISAKEAMRIREAICALELAMSSSADDGGESTRRQRIDALFPDLIDRAPERPDSSSGPDQPRQVIDGA